MTCISSSSNDLANNQAETIWNADIEQSFLEALAIYPPCGRRKIILTDDGKVYGRNELVARYIKIRTGKIRTRKQVSSHLQVLTKRRSKELQLLRQDKQAQQIILERLRQSAITDLQSKLQEDKQSSRMDLELSSGSSSESEISISPVQNLLSVSLQTGDQSSIDSIDQNHRKLPMTYAKETIKSSMFLGLMNRHSPSLRNTSPMSSSNALDQSRCSSSHSAFSPNAINLPSHQSFLPRPLLIGDESFHLLDLSASIEVKHTSHSLMVHSYSEISSISQHDLLRLNTNDPYMKNLSHFETIFIDQIDDKFDGLKALFDSHPQGSFFLVKFWVDLPPPFARKSTGPTDESFLTAYSFSSCFYQPILVSTRIYSFGKQVLEKIESTEYPQADRCDRFIHRFHRSPLCDYTMQFIQKLRSLSNVSLMNTVLENFTILQIIRSYDSTQRLLLCLAFVFEVAMLNSGGPEYQVYKLVAS